MYLQIIFVGQSGFEEKLTNSQRLRQINERLKIRLHIKALTWEESKDYIEHRLKLVGSSISKIFTPEAISMICSYAEGIPRIINILCDNALRRGHRLSRRRIDSDIIREVIRNLEGPIPRKGLLSPPSTSPKGICQFTPRLALSFKRLSIAILFLLCVVGFVLATYEYRQSKPTKTWRGKITLESPHHVSLAPASSSSAPEEDKIEEIVIVKEGRTISSIAEEYYHVFNPTIIAFILDFNPEVTNADFITVGQKIKVPKLTEESLILVAGHGYKINLGTFTTPESQEL